MTCKERISSNVYVDKINKVFVKNTMEKDLLFICFQCLIAGALCGFKKDGGTIPLNKNLW